MKTSFSNVNGWDVEIHTGKNYNGVIACGAQFGTSKEGNGYSTFEYAMFTDPNIVLAKSAPGTRATEKAIQTIHTAGLAKFEAMRAAGELPVKKSVSEIKIGQILFLNGYGQDEHSHKNEAVYKIEGQRYFTVNMSTLDLSSHEHVRPIEEKFGIGVYYKKGDTLPVEEVEAALIKAQEKREVDNLAKIEAKKAQEEARAAKIAEGAAEGRVNIPDEDTPGQAPADLGGDIAMLDYSEKAFIVRGEGTRAIKDDLRGLGGFFNFRLQGGPAWVFSKTKQDKVLNYLQGLKKRQDEVMGALQSEYSKLRKLIEA